MDRIAIIIMLAQLARSASARKTLITALADDKLLAELVRRQESPARHQAERLAAQQRAWMQARRGFALIYGAEDFPAALLDIPDPPVVLFGVGDASVFCDPAVAIVGSRNATLDSRCIAEDLAADLAAAGMVVVSGMARGVDGAAHRGALAAGGRTVAVLGAGLDRVYPPEHAQLAIEIARRGAVVSEFPLGTPPLPAQFPQRNRLISGLSAGAILIEAGEKSGSLSTARHALDQGREVMVVPGPVRDGRNRGGHGMIKSGAALIDDVLDVLRVFGVDAVAWAAEPPRGDVATARSPVFAGMRTVGTRSSANGPPADTLGAPEDPLQRALFDQLADGSHTQNELIDAVGKSAAEVSAALVALEVGGFVRLQGHVYSRPP